MITFKKFLEAAVSKEPSYKEIPMEQAVKVMLTHCYKAMWMVAENRPLWRGDRGAGVELATVDTSATVRASQNTSNHYTLLLDNLPAWRDWPKRSRSFICSTGREYASSYGPDYTGKLFAIIPYDGVKIGSCNDRDLWDTSVTLYGEEKGIESWNSAFEYLDLPDNDWDAWVKYAEELKKDPNSAEAKKFKRTFHIDMEADIDFMAELTRAYNPSRMGFEKFTTANMPRKGDATEMWVSGNVLMIKASEWDGFRLRALHGI